MTGERSNSFKTIECIKLRKFAWQIAELKNLNFKTMAFRNCSEILSQNL